MLHPQLEKIKKEMYLQDILNKEAVFKCYTDHCFTYEVEHKGISHQIGVINTNQCKEMFDVEKVVDLFDKPLHFMDYKTYSGEYMTADGKVDIMYRVEEINGGTGV